MPVQQQQYMSTGDSTPLVRARNVGIRRQGRWIIRHVDLDVFPGKLVYLIGANGAGKSTLAKSILGLMEVNEGTIERPAALKIGYVPQRLQVSPNLPLRLRRLLTLTRRYPPAEIEAALAAAGLDRLGDPVVSTLSGGEFQRALLARALLHRPELLVMDEPAQGVDAAGTGVLRERIENIRCELSCGVLLISHDMRLVMETGDDVVVLLPHEHDNPNPYLQGGAAPRPPDQSNE